ncbi:hypothetical protein [Acanthopleuribacter pedis]|uniref:N-acetyltransferase domain-containing protein n=1 Tax=Acanthopleuribacter pedis TaxID=442870 RepID=A0A8J7QE41_9BACT|nr:hypothetical protein [Acanthopleuribacter pedis]MBO1317438.1 hypothetical protein [Acanthopleuribacter pedis]
MTQSVLKPIPEIIYKSFSAEYLDETAELVSHMFLNHEPMTIVQNIPKTIYTDFVKVLLARTLEDGLTKIAVNREDNRVLGAMINEDLNDPQPEIFNDLHETFHPIFDLLERVGGPYLEANPPIKRRFFHMFMLAVDLDVSGQRVGDNLIDHSVAMARELGFQTAVVEATGPRSQKLFQEYHDFQPTHEIRYSDYTFEGKKVFGAVPNAESTKFMVLPLK